MTPDPPFTAAQIYSGPRAWIPGVVLLVLVVLAIVGLVAILHGGHR